MDLSKIPQYRSHKIVRALHIEAITYLEGGRGATLHFTEPGFAPYNITVDVAAKHAPRAPGVWIWYQDGYESYSPVASFEEGYTLLNSAADIKEVAEELVPAIGIAEQPATTGVTLGHVVTEEPPSAGV